MPNFSARLIDRPSIKSPSNQSVYQSFQNTNQSFSNSAESLISPISSHNSSQSIDNSIQSDLEYDDRSIHQKICEVNDESNYQSNHRLHNTSRNQPSSNGMLSDSKNLPINQPIFHPASARWLFKWLLLTESLMYLQAGATPAILPSINQAFNLSFNQQGMIGGAVYFCLSLFCPFAGWAIYKLDWLIDRLIAWSLVLHALSTAAFGLVPAPYDPAFDQSVDQSLYQSIYQSINGSLDPSVNQSLLILFRGCIGACQSLLIVLGPLWITHHAPLDQSVRWMSALQASVPLGIMTGYLIATICMGFETVDTTNDHPISQSINQGGCYFMACWRWPFVLQAMLTLPVAMMCFLYIKRSDVDVTVHRSHHQSINESINQSINESISPSNDDEMAPLLSSHLNQSYDQSGSINQSTDQSIDPPLTTWDALKELFANPIYVLIVTSLCCLYFVVTGVQFWSTAYLLDCLHGDPLIVRWTFIGVCATAPVFGVVAGGWIIDYRRANEQSVNQSINQTNNQPTERSAQDIANALESCLVLGLIACVACVPITLTNSIPMSVTSMWFLLFFGGCCMPGVMGCMIGCVDRRIRPWASSTAVVMFNAFGYCASPVMSGWVMSLTHSMVWGFRFVLAASFVSCLACWRAWKEAGKRSALK